MMSIIKQNQKKKDKRPRKRSEKSLRRKRVKRNIYKNRGWKLNYPHLFMEIQNYPYIVRKPN